MTHNHY